MSDTQDRYSISTCLFKGHTLEEMIEKVVAAGFKSVELASAEYIKDFLGRPGSIRQRLAAAGLRAWSAHSPCDGWNNSAADRAERRKSVRAAARMFRPAAEVGVEIVICHCNARVELVTAESYADSKARSIESLGILAERAKEAGVKIAVENLPARGTVRPGTSVAELLEMIDGLGDQVGLCVDAGHSNANGYVAAEDVRLAGDKLLAVHIQDNDGRGQDQHLVPGTGTTDWKAFLAGLDEIGFAGPRTFEVEVGERAIDAALKKVADLRSAWAG